MRHMKQVMVVAFVGVAFLSLGATLSWAGHEFKKLSKNHLLFGVSQFLAGNINAVETTPLKLFNPNHVTQVAAALFYERESEGGGPRPGGSAEEFQACLVRVLTPHGALQFRLDFLETGRLYVEVISAPATPVRKGKRKEKDDDEDENKYNKHRGHMKRELRLADGLGIRGTAALTNFASVPLSMVHPGLFSLPSDDVVEGQRQAAIDCVCGALPAGSDPDVFEEFGISCPE